MTRQVLFVQGAGEGAHREDAKLAQSLREKLGPGYEVRYPQMPEDDNADDAAWEEVIATELAEMGDNPILVGHSAGAATLCSFLATRGPELRITGLFLISAPFFGQGGWEVEGFALPGDLGRRLSDGPVFLYHGDADEIAPAGHLELYARAMPQAIVRRLKGRDHQLNEDMTEVAHDILRLV